MHVALLFPPAVDPRSPHLALPSLAAALRREGARVELRDLNLEGLLWHCAPARLAEAAEACRARLDIASGDARIALRQALARAGFVVEGAQRAIAALRDPGAFFDPDRHHEARATLRQALALVSAASGRVRYELSSAAYEVEGTDRGKLRDLISVTGDPSANLFQRFWEEELFPGLDADRPDFVGVSILNGQQVLPGLMLCRALRARGHRVIVGGTVFAKFVPQLQRRPEFFAHFCEALVPYEGEAAFRGLLADPDDLSRAPNLLSLDARGRPTLGPVQVERVDDLPTPDYTGLPLSSYLAPHPVLPILTGKGCYFNRCKFCDIPHINHISEKAYRVRSPELVADDLATLHRRHGARHFVVTDEALSPRLLLRLADALEARGVLAEVRPRLVGYARLEPGFTAETCRRLHAMGMRKLYFGLESASQRVLDHMDKGIRVADAPPVLRHCADAGIAAHVFSIVGFPEEQEADARATLAFFRDHAEVLAHPRNSLDIHRFGLDLRTEYYENAARYGVDVDLARVGAQDFPTTARSWQNTRGLGESDVQRLLDEFEGVLRATFAGTRLYPEQHWPGFEEYAVLYGDRYEDAPFLHRTALPASGERARFRLQWAESARFGEPQGGAQVVWGVGGGVTLGALALRVLDPLPGPQTVDGLLDELAARLPHAADERASLQSELRQAIDLLLGARLLWYRPAEAPARPVAARGPVRLRPEVELRVAYDDRTRLGGPVSGRLEQSVRRVYASVLAHARAEGLEATLAAGPALLRAAQRAPAFAELGGVAGGRVTLHEHVLHPDPADSPPVALQLARPGEPPLRLEVDPEGWPALGDLLARLAGEGCDPGSDHDLLRALAARDLLAPADDAPALAGPLTRCALTFVGHNTVVVRSSTTALVVDPYLVPGTDHAGYRPLRRRDLGGLDAALITHAHPDHFDPGTLLQCGLDTPVIVPRVARESLLSIDLARRLAELGFRKVVPLGWGERVAIGDLEVHALPFYGEQPTSGAVLHPEVRNQGNCYVVAGPGLRAAFVADAGRDHAGDLREVASRWRAQHGRIDALFAGYRGWLTYPVQLLFSSVPQYVPLVPEEEWDVRQQLMTDAAGAVELAERWGAATLVPYGAGGAPWYWERGLGPRLDGEGREDPSFDPFPERVAEAAARRLNLGARWVASPVKVRILRPGDGLADVRGDAAPVRAPGHAWPWEEHTRD